MRTEILVSCLLMLTTVTYSLVAWHLSAIWSTLVSDPELVSILSVYTIKPLKLSPEYGMLHWQLLGFISLVVNLRWGLRKAKSSGNINELALPICCHLCWLFFSLCAHIAGGLASFVGIMHVLK